MVVIFGRIVHGQLQVLVTEIEEEVNKQKETTERNFEMKSVNYEFVVIDHSAQQKIVLRF